MERAGAAGEGAMSAPPDDPVRWGDTGADDNAIQRRAASLAEAAADVPALGPEALARVRQAVLARDFATSPRAWRRLSTGVRISILAGMLLGLATTAGGASLLWRKYIAVSPERLTPQQIGPVDSAARRRTARLRHQRSPGPSAPGEPEPAPTPDLERAPGSAAAADPMPETSVPPPSGRAPPPVASSAGALPHPPVAVRHAVALMARPAPRERLAPSEPETETETETRLLARALSQLRQSHNPRAALSILDRYSLLFPHGVLESESMRTRLEAVVALDDLKTALALLDVQTTFADPLGFELLLTRAELRAAAGRCGEGVADFTGVLEARDARASDLTIERALYGRAVCRGRLGQDDRARDELHAYLRRFPHGRFESEVRRLLGEPAAPAPG